LRAFKKEPTKKIRDVLLLAAVCVLAVFLFLLAYQFNNKYTVQQPQAVDGVLTLDSEILAAYPVLFLVDGWEYYGGELLSPKDFSKPPPPLNTSSWGSMVVLRRQQGGRPPTAAPPID